MSLNEGIQEIQGIQGGRDRREAELSAFSFEFLAFSYLKAFGFAFAFSFKLLAFSSLEAFGFALALSFKL